jgi:predicted O-methyltransferase YrrM
VAVSYPHESLIDSHQDGCTEPWIAEAVCALLKAKGGKLSILETGGFMGTTSAWLVLTLQQMGGGEFWVCEIDGERAAAIQNRLDALPLEGVEWAVLRGDALTWISEAEPQMFDVVWIDDDHQKHHVEQEINALWTKMRPGGLMLFHDIDPPCDLQTVIRKYGGIALHLPKLGPSGGLGIIQVPL